MKICYAVTVCSDSTYEKLFGAVPVKPAFQAQKYHRLLIEGLAAGAQVDVVANPPGNGSMYGGKKILLPEETAGGARYHNLPAISNPIHKLLKVFLGTFSGTLKYTDRDSAVVVDCLNRTAALAAMLASKVRRCPCVGIVTDLPDMLSGRGKALANFVIRHCTHYVLLTEAMNQRLNPKGKPYVILEGQSDIAMKDKTPCLAEKLSPRVVLYAGGVSRKYGLPQLTEGFLKADLKNAQLHIYGPGDYVEELKKIQDPRVFYGGMLLSSEIVEKERQATLLVNPRPTNEEYVKYSFPSKTMEYMASGTPVLTTRLPGMPKDYYPYVSFIEEETAEGVAAALKQVLQCSREELLRKGLEARRFVLDERNNVIQASKILDMLKK